MICTFCFPPFFSLACSWSTLIHLDPSFCLHLFLPINLLSCTHFHNYPQTSYEKFAILMRPRIVSGGFFFLLSIIWSSSQVQSFQLNLSSITLKQFLVMTFPSASWECQCLVVFVRICASVCLTDCLSCICLLCCVAISKITLKLELSGLLVAFLAIEC